MVRSFRGEQVITLISKNVTSFFIKNETILGAEREVYEYSFEILFSTLMSLVAVVMIAIISKTIIYTLLFLAGFIPLRTVAGGYHAKNHFRCFLILLAVYSAFLLSITILPTDLLVFITISCLFITVALVFLLAPSGDENKPIPNVDATHLKRNSRLLILAYTMVIGITVYFFQNNFLAFSLTMGVFAVGISLIANKIKYTVVTNSNAVSRKDVAAIEKETQSNDFGML